MMLVTLAAMLTVTLFIGIFLFVILAVIQSLYDWGVQKREIFRDNRNF